MARALGYGGIANTNGARSFSGKAEADIVPASASTFNIALSMGINALALLFPQLLLSRG